MIVFFFFSFLFFTYKWTCSFYPTWHLLLCFNNMLQVLLLCMQMCKEVSKKGFFFSWLKSVLECKLSRIKLKYNTFGAIPCAFVSLTCIFTLFLFLCLGIFFVYSPHVLGLCPFMCRWVESFLFLKQCDCIQPY